MILSFCSASSSTEASVCQACQANAISAAGSVGQEYCYCNPGYSHLESMHACRQCTPGTYNNQLAQRSCSNCTIGMYSLNYSAISLDMEELKWEVYDADKKKDWKTYTDMKATVISGSDLVWTLDECDVVIKKVSEDMVVSLMHRCSEMYRQHMEVSDDRAVQHLDHMNWILHKMIQSHKKSDEPDMQGACIVCHERSVTEVLLPCCHVCFCSVCIKEYTGQCPICRTSIEATCNAHVYNTRMNDKANKLFYQYNN